MLLRRGIAPVILLTLIALGACGGGDDSATTDDTSDRELTTTTEADDADTSTTTVGASTTVAASGSGGGPDVTKACSFVTDREVSEALGVTVTASDEGFRCRYKDQSGGWLEVSLAEFTSRSSQESFNYAKTNGDAVAGLGDEAHRLGAEFHVKVGDVYLFVSGSNLASGSTPGGPEQVTRTIVSRIP